MAQPNSSNARNIDYININFALNFRDNILVALIFRSSRRLTILGGATINSVLSKDHTSFYFITRSIIVPLLLFIF